MSLRQRVQRIANATASLRCPLCCDGRCSWQSSRAVIVNAGETVPAASCPACSRPRTVFVLTPVETVSIDGASMPGVSL